MKVTENREATSWYVKYNTSMYALGLYQFDNYVTADLAAEEAKKQFGSLPDEVWPGDYNSGTRIREVDEYEFELADQMEDCVCPHCGNTEDITHCFLEWRISPVVGKKGDKVQVDWSSQEGTDFDTKGSLENIPNIKPDFDHLFCAKCGWNWFAETEEA